MRESDERKIHAVEHQLDRHEHRNEIALDEKADHTQAEQGRAEQQVPRYWDHLLTLRSPVPARARATAPRMAIRMSTEVTSKGSSRSLNSTLLRSSVLVIGSLKDATPSP